MEINYCYNCHSRVSSVDIDSKRAYETEKGWLCKACAGQLGIEDLLKNGAAQSVPVNRAGPSRTRPRPAAPQSGHKAAGILIGVFLVVSIGAAVAVLKSKTGPPAPQPNTETPEPESISPDNPAEPAPDIRSEARDNQVPGYNRSQAVTPDTIVPADNTAVSVVDTADGDKQFTFVPVDLAFAAGGTWMEQVVLADAALDGTAWHTVFMGKRRRKPAQRSFGYAVSPNGISNWQVQTRQPMLQFEGNQIKPENAGLLTCALGRNPDTSLARYDEKWVLVFANYDGVNCTLQWALSPDGINWTSRGETGIKQGPVGTPARQKVWVGSLIKDADGVWHCFYFGDGNRATIGLASGPAPDQLKPYWKALLKPNQTWEGEMVTFPKVFKSDTGWIMVYSSDHMQNSIGLARSHDLKTWYKDAILIKGQGRCMAVSKTAGVGDNNPDYRLYLQTKTSAQIVEIDL